jgi:flagellar biosynthesis GTPase FlhF
VPGANSDCTIVNAVLATTALPDWFPAVTIGSIYSKEQLIGGSIGFNNPTKKALEEAARLFGSEHQVSIIISFGTGQQQTRSLTKSNTEGLQEVLSAMVQEGDSVTDDLAQRFNGSSFYHRFSVESGIGAVTITEWSESELRSITSRTKSYMERNSSSLDAVVKKLVENKGSHTLGQISESAGKHSIICSLLLLAHVKTNATTAKSVPRLSPYYVTRDEVYDSMERCLIRDFGGDQRLFVIMGMGGVGKTQSASFFARRNRDR